MCPVCSASCKTTWYHGACSAQISYTCSHTPGVAMVPEKPRTTTDETRERKLGAESPGRIALTSSCQGQASHRPYTPPWGTARTSPPVCPPPPCCNHPLAPESRMGDERGEKDQANSSRIRAWLCLLHVAEFGHFLGPLCLLQRQGTKVSSCSRACCSYINNNSILSLINSMGPGPMTTGGAQPRVVVWEGKRGCY